MPKDPSPDTLPNNDRFLEILHILNDWMNAVPDTEDEETLRAYFREFQEIRVEVQVSKKNLEEKRDEIFRADPELEVLYKSRFVDRNLSWELNITSHISEALESMGLKGQIDKNQLRKKYWSAVEAFGKQLSLIETLEKLCRELGAVFHLKKIDQPGLLFEDDPKTRCERLKHEHLSYLLSWHEQQIKAGIKAKEIAKQLGVSETIYRSIRSRTTPFRGSEDTLKRLLQETGCISSD